MTGNRIGGKNLSSNSSGEPQKEDLGKLFPIVVVEYDPRWIEQYEEEAGFLRRQFGPDLIVRLEHYGSTAVPGLAAKPVVDILIEITSFEKAEREIRPVLERLGYGYNWYADHMAFFKGYFPEVPQKYHLHMAPGDHLLMDNLLFRDYLRKHPKTAKDYENLKYQLAELYRNDREAYTDAKGDFVRKVIEMARMEY